MWAQDLLFTEELERIHGLILSPPDPHTVTEHVSSRKEEAGPSDCSLALFSHHQLELWALEQALTEERGVDGRRHISNSVAQLGSQGVLCNLRKPELTVDPLPVPSPPATRPYLSPVERH
jgi:hypothetical protein